MTSNLPERVLRKAQEHNLEEQLLAAPLVVGVSGGADSLALLHILCALRGERAPATLYVAHLDHGFRGGEGEADADFVRRTAAAWGLPCATRYFDVPSYARHHRLSAEDAARRVRYSFLAGVARAEGCACVAVAHNADDRAETVLMNLLRGTGITGLVGMRPLHRLVAHAVEPGATDTPRDSPGIHLFRPLLGVWRSEIEEYCRQQGLQPRQDATNYQLDYRRNRIRHELIPLLERQYSQAIKQHLTRLSDIAEEEDRLVEEIARQAANAVLSFDEETRVATFDLDRMAGLSKAIRRRLARQAIEAVAGTLEGFSFHHVESVARLLDGRPTGPTSLHLPHNLVAARQDTQVRIALRGSLPAITPANSGDWPTISGGTERELWSGVALPLGGSWTLYSSIGDHPGEGERPGEMLALFDMDVIEQMGPLVVRTRRRGDFIRPLGMQGRKSLQDLFVDAKIPSGLRDLIPVIALSSPPGEVLWVPGRGGRRSRHAPVHVNTSRILRLEMRMEGQRGGSADDAGA